MNLASPLAIDKHAYILPPDLLNVLCLAGSPAAPRELQMNVQQLQAVYGAMGLGHSAKPSATVLRKALARLEPDEKLNDNIINAAVKLLANAPIVGPYLSNTCWFMETNFWGKLFRSALCSGNLASTQWYTGYHTWLDHFLACLWYKPWSSAPGSTGLCVLLPLPCLYVVQAMVLSTRKYWPVLCAATTSLPVCGASHGPQHQEVLACFVYC